MLNASDIDHALNRIPWHCKSLVKAAEFLKGLKDLLQATTDGWHCVSSYCKSEDLQQIVKDAQWPVNQYPDTRVKPAKIKAACMKPVEWLQTHPQMKDRPETTAFLYQYANWLNLTNLVKSDKV